MGVNSNYRGDSMELGEKLKQARLEAGLSQRALCGDTITRNMLSQIENGTANPSMDTLRYLAGALGKPVSYFLEEQPDPCPGEEGLLHRLGTLHAAEVALQGGKQRYAAELLHRLDVITGGWCAAELERKRLLLLAQAEPWNAAEVCGMLPSLDEELLLRARAALEAGNAERCHRLALAAEDQTSPVWNLVRGEAFFLQGDYGQAAACYHLAEEVYPQQTVSRLEQCFRELGDFRQAYFYACKQR